MQLISNPAKLGVIKIRKGMFFTTAAPE